MDSKPKGTNGGNGSGSGTELGKLSKKDKEREGLATAVLTAFNAATLAKDKPPGVDIGDNSDIYLGDTSNMPKSYKGAQLPPRKLKNWLQSYLELTDGQESPESFHFWCGMSAIAACLRRNVWMQKGFYQLYPNIYVILIATSAECRKSTAVKFSEKLVQQVPQVKMIQDKMTPEGLLQRLATTVDLNAAAHGELGKDGQIKKDGSIYIVAHELRMMFSQLAYVSGLIEIITGLYDCPDKSPYTTRHSPIEVHNACINLLGASTPEWLATGFPDHNTSGGFLGRFIFVVAHKPKRKVAWPEIDESAKVLYDAIAHDLKCIGRLSGPVTVTKEARSIYKEWYDKYRIPAIPRLHDYYGRKQDTVLKLAMLLSISTSNDLIIRPTHINTAIKATVNVEQHMLDAFAFLGATTESILAREILSMLADNGPMRRGILLKSVSYRLKRIKDFDDALSILYQEEKIKKEHANTGKKEDLDAQGNPKLVYRITTEEEKIYLESKKKKKAKIIGHLFDEEGNYLG